MPLRFVLHCTVDCPPAHRQTAAVLTPPCDPVTPQPDLFLTEVDTWCRRCGRRWWEREDWAWRLTRRLAWALCTASSTAWTLGRSASAYTTDTSTRWTVTSSESEHDFDSASCAPSASSSTLRWRHRMLCGCCGGRRHEAVTQCDAWPRREDADERLRCSR